MKSNYTVPVQYRSRPVGLNFVFKNQEKVSNRELKKNHSFSECAFFDAFCLQLAALEILHPND